MRLQPLHLWSHYGIVNDMDFSRVLKVRLPCWISLWNFRIDCNTRLGVCDMRSWARVTLYVRILFLLMYNFRQKGLSLNVRTHLNEDRGKFHHIQVQTRFCLNSYVCRWKYWRRTNGSGHSFCKSSDMQLFSVCLTLVQITGSFWQVSD